jgi:hypothetical protein
MTDNNTLREFSYSRPITYKGVPYPSAPANILTDGQQTPVNVFADANGSYYVLDNNGSAKSVMPVHTLDEVVVTPSKENLLSAQFNEYLTQSNDKTQVLDTPHREYNPHLKTKFLEGAHYHAAWEKEHPNLTAWSQALSAVPFAVASTPLVGALGQAALATTAGQTARAGIASLMSNPIVDAANTGLGLGFAAKGAYDVSQGKFTPETAMDLMGLYPYYKGVDELIGRWKNSKKSTNSIREAVSTDSQEGTVFNTLLDDSTFDNIEPVDMDNWETIDLSDSSPTGTPIKARNIKEGDIPYTDEEINALVNENGKLKEGLYFTDKVKTGAHGVMYAPYINPKHTPNWILKQHLLNTDPNNPYGASMELRRIMNDNPTGRSGILVETHTGDTSIDSTPLAYIIATRLGKKFKPLNNNLERVVSNSYGYNNVFKTNSEVNALKDRAKALFAKNPDYEATLIRDTNGNMIAYELTDDNGTFQIPLNSRQEVLDIMNARLHKFNKHYGTSYRDIEPKLNINNVFYDPNNPYPWDFGEKFDLPNIYGIAYKKGGKIKRRLLTQFF